MKITAIKAAVKTKGRFNIFVDGAYKFSLDELQLVSTGVRTGKEYTEAELTTLLEESAFGKAYARALEYIMRRPRSEKELRDYAWRKKWEPAMTERVIARLFEKRHLDDAAFAVVWVRHRSLGRPTSLRKLRLELRQKGIAEEHVETALATGDGFDEKDALQRLVDKKRARYPDPQKFIAYLMRQGYSYDAVKRALSDQPADDE